MNYDDLRAKALAATPGEWRWHTGCSWRRLASYVDGRNERDGNVICPTTDRNDRHPDLIVSREDQEFIAAANPATVLSLLDEIAALRDAFRSVALQRYSDGWWCHACGRANERAEEHKPGCLAAIDAAQSGSSTSEEK